MKAQCRFTLFTTIYVLGPSVAGASVQVSIDDRSDNSFGLEGEWDTDSINLGYQDCVDDIEVTLDIIVSGEDTSGRELYVFSGDDCDDSDDSDECDDEILKYDADETEIEVHVSWMLDDADCDGDLYTSIWVGLLESSRDKEDNAAWATRIDVDFDSFTPDPPETISVDPGENALYVEWEVADGEEEGGLVVYAKADNQPELDAGIETCEGPLTKGAKLTETMRWKEADDSEEKAKVSGLTNGVLYQVGVVSLDEYGNPSDLSEVICGTPDKTIGFTDRYGDAGGGAGEFCFIATGAFGDYDHPVVKTLRLFRDEFLRKLPLGENLIHLYYQIGPAIVSAIGNDEQVWQIVRVSLYSAAAASVLLRKLGPGTSQAALFILLILGILHWLAASRKGGQFVSPAMKSSDEPGVPCFGSFLSPRRWRKTSH